MDPEKIRLCLDLDHNFPATNSRGGYTVAEVVVEIAYEMDASDSFASRRDEHRLRKVVAKRKFPWDPDAYDGRERADEVAREWAAEGVQATFAAFFASDVEEDR